MKRKPNLKVDTTELKRLRLATDISFSVEVDSPHGVPHIFTFKPTFREYASDEQVTQQLARLMQQKIVNEISLYNNWSEIDVFWILYLITTL